MNVAVFIVGGIGLLALTLVGSIAYLEIKPLLDARRARLEQFGDETTRIYVGPRRFHDHSPGYGVTLILSLLLIAIAWWEWSRFEFRGEWRTVQGVVLDGHFEPEPDGSGQHAVLWFTYRVGGRDYTSEWIDGDGAVLAYVDDPAAFREMYRAGASITVWYHPLLPHFPSLGRVTLWYVILALASGMFLLVTSSLSLVLARRLRIGDRRDAIYRVRS